MAKGEGKDQAKLKEEFQRAALDSLNDALEVDESHTESQLSGGIGPDGLPEGQEEAPDAVKPKRAPAQAERNEEEIADAPIAPGVEVEDERAEPEEEAPQDEQSAPTISAAEQRIAFLESTLLDMQNRLRMAGAAGEKPPEKPLPPQLPPLPLLCWWLRTRLMPARRR